MEYMNTNESSCRLFNFSSLCITIVLQISNEFEGIEGLCNRLKTDAVVGLKQDSGDLQKRKSVFGSNTIPPAKSKSFARLVFDACRVPRFLSKLRYYSL